MWVLFIISISIAAPKVVKDKLTLEKRYTIRDVYNEGCRASCIISGDSGGFIGDNNHCYCTIDKGTYREFINRTMNIGAREWVPSKEEKDKGMVAPFIFTNTKKRSISLGDTDDTGYGDTED